MSRLIISCVKCTFTTCFLERGSYVRFLSLTTGEVKFKIFRGLVIKRNIDRYYVVIIISFSVLQRNAVLLIICRLQHPHAHFSLKINTTKAFVTPKVVATPIHVKTSWLLLKRNFHLSLVTNRNRDN